MHLKKLTESGKRAAEIFSSYNLSDDMFYQKGRGIPAFISGLASGSVKEPNNYVREIEKHHPGGRPVNQFLLQKALESGLESTA
jgi:hypothetical protein